MELTEFTGGGTRDLEGPRFTILRWIACAAWIGVAPCLADPLALLLTVPWQHYAHAALFPILSLVGLFLLAPTWSRRLSACVLLLLPATTAWLCYSGFYLMMYVVTYWPVAVTAAVSTAVIAARELDAASRRG